MTCVRFCPNQHIHKVIWDCAQLNLALVSHGKGLPMLLPGQAGIQGKGHTLWRTSRRSDFAISVLAPVLPSRPPSCPSQEKWMEMQCWWGIEYLQIKRNKMESVPLLPNLRACDLDVREHSTEVRGWKILRTGQCGSVPTQSCFPLR